MRVGVVMLLLTATAGAYWSTSEDGVASSRDVYPLLVEGLEPAQAAEMFRPQQVITGDMISLVLGPPQITSSMGRSFTFQVTITNRSAQAIEVYNPMLDRSFREHRAMSLEIRTEHGVFIGDLLATFVGPNPTVFETTWQDLRPGESVSTDVSSYGHRVSYSDFDSYELPPGKYVLNLSAFHHLISGRPDLSWFEKQLRESLIRQYDGKTMPDWLQGLARPLRTQQDLPSRQDYGEWERTFPGSYICSSNEVRLDILPKVIQ